MDLHLLTSLGCGGSEGKKSACNVGDWGRCPGEGNDNPLSVFLPGESHGQRSLLGYVVDGVAESDLTESHTHTHTRVNMDCF